MSALGHKRTLEQASEMSALPPKADMRLAIQKCPLSAINGHLRGHVWPLRGARPEGGVDRDRGRLGRIRPVQSVSAVRQGSAGYTDLATLKANETHANNRGKEGTENARER